MNRRLKDMMMRRRMSDGRNPYGSKGGYVVYGRRGRDMLMMDDMRRYNENPQDYNLADMTRQNRMIEHDPYMPYDYAMNGRGNSNNSGRVGMNNSRGDNAGRNYDYGTGKPYAGVHDFPYEQYGYEMDGRGYEQYRQSDMGTRYPFVVGGEFGRYDGHYPYPYPHYPMYDFGGDYGEKLTKEELEHWNKKLLKEVDEKYKHFFTKENMANKARTLGIQMSEFTEDELLTATLMLYTDFCDALKPYVGENMDVYVRMARAFLVDPDASVKGGEKLAVYHDCIVEGEDD